MRHRTHKQGKKRISFCVNNIYNWENNPNIPQSGTFFFGKIKSALSTKVPPEEGDYSVPVQEAKSNSHKL